MNLMRTAEDFRVARADSAGRNYGAGLNTWPLVLENLLQCFGGDFFNGSNFREMTIDSPESLAALEMVQRMRFVDKTVYPAAGPSAGDINVQLFYTGKVAAIGPVGRWETPHFRGTGPGDPGITKFKWDIVPLPHGKQRASAIAVVAWSISSATKHPDEAFELLRFLTGPDGQTSMAKLGLAVPSLKDVAKSDAFMVGQAGTHAVISGCGAGRADFADAAGPRVHAVHGG